MEYAIRIISPTEKPLVTITQMQELGEEVARSYSYQCPDDDCRVSVFPSFPQKREPGRIKAPRPYFSARGESHREFCQQDGMFVLADKVRRRPPIRTLTPKAEALLADYPMRFDESEHKLKGGDSDDGGTLGGVSPTVIRAGGVRSSGEDSPETRVSVRSSRHVREFVRVYEGIPEARPHLPIKISGCPAYTYAQAFRHISKAVAARDREVRRIYWGDYSRHKTTKSGTAIYFKGKSDDNLPLGIWVPSEIGTRNFTQEIMRRLDRASHEPGAKIYVLGRFEPWDEPVWKYSVPLDKLNYLWISFPDDD
jgi:hypothetical protein